MTVFVIMGERGEYSDRSVWAVEVKSTEQAARDRIVEIQKENRIKYFVDNARSSYVSEHMRAWEAVNPRPVLNIPERPKFDHGIDQRAAQRQHMINLEAWRNECAEPSLIHKEMSQLWSDRHTAEYTGQTETARLMFTEHNVNTCGNINEYELNSYFIDEVPYND